MSEELFAGLDIGTSGVRAVVIDQDGEVVAQASRPMTPPEEIRDGARVQNPVVWRDAAFAVLEEIARAAPGPIRALAVDGTSGTLLLTDRSGTPLGPARMYNDASAGHLAASIRDLAPPESGAHGATSPLARLRLMQDEAPGAAHALHQADWIQGLLTGRFGVSDDNNALKTGFDPVSRTWPTWIEAFGVHRGLLPAVVVPGTVIGPVLPEVARGLGLNPDLRLVAGTTDGCASFLATGAAEVGEGVSALGSTLTLKLLSERPVFSPAHGVYSHRLGDVWLAGGAANAGGTALLRFFEPAEIEALTHRLRPERPTGFGWHPLPGRGERFPVADPDLTFEPDRPDDDVLFLQVCSRASPRSRRRRIGCSKRSAGRRSRRSGRSAAVPAIPPGAESGSGCWASHWCRRPAWTPPMAQRSSRSGERAVAEPIRIVLGVEDLIERYDGFLIDQFGVLHDGRRALPGALDALCAIRAAGKPVVLLSNSGRRSRPNEERLIAMGIGRELYLAMVTSGETAWLGLGAGDDPLFQGLGGRALLFSRGGDRSAIDGLDLETVTDPDRATFVLMSGIDADNRVRADCRRRLEHAVKLGLPMLCTNPDTVSIEGSRHCDGPGALAARYAESGGDVRYVGKPWRAIYEVALRTIAKPPRRLLAIGDSLGHDVAGASRIGIDAALTTSGVHRDEFAGVAGDALLERFDRLAGDSPRPKWLMAALRPTTAD